MDTGLFTKYLFYFFGLGTSKSAAALWFESPDTWKNFQVILAQGCPGSFEPCASWICLLENKPFSPVCWPWARNAESSSQAWAEFIVPIPCLHPELISLLLPPPRPSLTNITLLLAHIYPCLTRVLQDRMPPIFPNRSSCSGNKRRQSASRHLLLSQPDFYSLQNCKCAFQADLLDGFPKVHCRCTVCLQWQLHTLMHTYIWDGNE